MLVPAYRDLLHQITADLIRISLTNTFRFHHSAVFLREKKIKVNRQQTCEQRPAFMPPPPVTRVGKLSPCDGNQRQLRLPYQRQTAAQWLSALKHDFLYVI